jgi:2-oxoglutarate ferredoxin oxidoreductase subunit beta
VTFNNKDESVHSYSWGKEHEVALHELAYVPPAEEIMVDYGEGETTEVTMHDGSKVILKKVEQDYDPRNRAEAMRVLEEANAKRWLLTGLIYINTEQPSLLDIYNLTETALNRLKEPNLRPGPDTIEQVNNLMF